MDGNERDVGGSRRELPGGTLWKTSAHHSEFSLQLEGLEHAGKPRRRGETHLRKTPKSRVGNNVTCAPQVLLFHILLFDLQDECTICRLALFGETLVSLDSYFSLVV